MYYYVLAVHWHNFVDFPILNIVDFSIFIRGFSEDSVYAHLPHSWSVEWKLATIIGPAVISVIRTCTLNKIIFKKKKNIFELSKNGIIFPNFFGSPKTIPDPDYSLKLLGTGLCRSLNATYRINYFFPWRVSMQHYQHWAPLYSVHRKIFQLSNYSRIYFPMVRAASL